MAVALRMQRHGAKRRPFYHIVATDSRNPRDGRFLDQLGVYDPRGDKPLALNEEKVLRWLGQGAQPSATVKRLIARAGIVPGAVAATAKVESAKAEASTTESADDAGSSDGAESAADTQS